MLEKLQKTVFFLLVFFMSSQVGLHFWPKFAYIDGIKIDYLSPTLYLLDVLIIPLIAILLFDLIKKKKKINFPKSNFIRILFTVFILDIILNFFFARSPAAHLFGVMKVIEFALFATYMSLNFKKQDIPYFVDILSLSAITSSGLAIWQFLEQSSIGGIWYFLGERTFTPSTIGIATANINGEALRVYGAFPHPNVLAFFLLFVVVFISLKVEYEKKIYEKLFFVIVFSLSSLALLLTFSRIVIFIYLIFLAYLIFKKLSKRNLLYIIPLLGLIILYLSTFYSRFLNIHFLLRDIGFRQELAQQSVEIFKNNLYFGIGLNNFFIHQAPLIKNISPVLFQPPHNIFVLALLSLGLFGFWIFPYIFYLSFRSLFAKLRTTNGELKDFHKSVLFILLAIIIVGIFDHFFLTLEQGQIMLALILGLSFAKIKG